MSTKQTHIATLDAILADALGMGNEPQPVLLSKNTKDKQRIRHPDLTPDDYARIQDLINSGEAIREDARHLIIQERQDGQWWKIVIKSTKDRQELYLLTLHRIRKRDVEANRRKGKTIRC